MPALPHYVSIQQPVRTENSIGEMEVTYTDLFPCMAKIAPLSAKERFANEQVSHLTTDLVTLRFDSRITTAHRIRYGTRILAIDGLINVNERGRELQAMCYEVRAG
jgi:SPP1 family predicted phage head-tail adaptor